MAAEACQCNGMIFHQESVNLFLPIYVIHDRAKGHGKKIMAFPAVHKMCMPCLNPCVITLNAPFIAGIDK